MIHIIFKFFVTLGSEWVLTLLIFLSVVILAIAWERARLLGKIDRQGRQFWQERVSTWLSNGVPANWSQVAAPAHSLEAKLINLVSQNQSKSPAAMETLCDALIQSEKITLENRLSILGTLGNNAPYLGLIGTVIGIIRAFAALATQSNSASSSLNASLAEALVSTAVGIFVALEAVIFFNIFNRKAKVIIERAHALKNVLIGGIRG